MTKSPSMDLTHIGDAMMAIQVDLRASPRFPLRVRATIHCRTGEIFFGWTCDISESGIAVLLCSELRVGQLVELNLGPPLESATFLAVVKNRNAFRYGLQLILSNDDHASIRKTCSALERGF
jgi:hypothetical protein